MKLLEKLGESNFIKKKVRQNTYIRNVDCMCESNVNNADLSFHGQNCFCELDYDLFGKSHKIYTHVTQPTFNMKIKIDPVNYMKFADIEPLN